MNTVDPEEFNLAPDIFTLDIPADAVQDVRQLESGKTRIEFTPEQAEKFEQFLRSEVFDARE